MSAPDRTALLRQLPSVDDILSRPGIIALANQISRRIVVDATRSVLEELRREVIEASKGVESLDRLGLPSGVAIASLDRIEEAVKGAVARALAPSLRPVINATGVVLHTNLGRAPLAAAAIEHLRATATQYSNLEYDVAAGQRGKRDTHTARLLARVTGAEAAIVVNNNAAAILLALNTFAKGGEVIVSRGELVEIGDGFRIPDIMAESGATLREVGTTNKTTIADYERAISDRTRLLLRVHPSNFRVSGFTARPALEELVALGRRFTLPVFEDLGSGCLVDLSAQGFQEPVVRASLEAGADLVSFSGDKLLGGPQAGIIAGAREPVERVRRNPMFRALRVDKLTIAALEATLLAYLREDYDSIPALRMIRATQEQIAARAALFAERLRAALPDGAAVIELLDGASVVGGGSTPDQTLPTKLIAIKSAGRSADELETRLRVETTDVPIIARIENDAVVLDLRTVFPEQEPQLQAALIRALA